MLVSPRICDDEMQKNNKSGSGSGCCCCCCWCGDTGGLKRKRGADRVFALQSFGDPGYPADFYGAFRDNIRDFLQGFAEPEDYSSHAMPVWSLRLDSSNGCHFTLYVVQEDIANTSLNPHCDHCRCIGWSHHLVSRQRFHFIIPPPSKTGAEALNLLSKVLWPNLQTQAESETNLLLLHGVIHTNGFGHLLSLNGRETQSHPQLFGRDIMDLWDRLCSMLRTRKISLEDVARKRNMELRLLHSVAYGESWFGRWGYKFGHGSYGVTQQMHSKAIDELRCMPLSLLHRHFQAHAHAHAGRLLAVLTAYQRLSSGAGGLQQMQTLGDLLRFMLELKSRLPFEPPATPADSASQSPASSSVTTEQEGPPCRWSAKRLELATQVIVEALRKAGRKRMPRQDVRDAARLRIGDTGLLDFVLKSLGNRVVGPYVVRRAVNPVSKVLEYSLDNASVSASPPAEPPASQGPVTRVQVVDDILLLYGHVLVSAEPAAAALPTAARIVLDTKQLMKDYRGETTRNAAMATTTELSLDEDEMLRVLCYAAFPEEAAAAGSGRPPAPPEVVVVPPHCTVGDLKREAQTALRETYAAMQNFAAVSVVGLDGGGDADDEELLFGALNSGSTVVIRGGGVDVAGDLVYEGGSDSWTVDCPCGARDDDGEPMIACDICEVWQHTRCGGIADSDDIPQCFLCSRCRHRFFRSSSADAA